MNKRLYTSGMSLAEVVISIGLFALILLVLFNFFISYNATYRFERAFIETAGSAGVALREFEALVRPAFRALDSHTFAAGTYTSGAATLVLELPAIDATGHTIVGEYDYVVFYQDGAKLYRILEADAASERNSGTKLLSSTVTALTFTYNNVSVSAASVVTIAIETGTLIKGELFGTSLTEAIRLRNFISS